METDKVHGQLLNPSSNENAMTHPVTRSWRWAVSTRRRRLFAFLLMLVPVVVFFFRSDLYLTRMTLPTLPIERPELATCCLDRHIKQDTCGRTDCLWPCPYTRTGYERLETDDPKVFFHETSGARSLTYRQACSVESLARANPNLTIHLLMTSKPDASSLVMKTLTQSYGNIHVTGINLGDYMIDTPLANWYFCTTWNYGPWVYAHMSDALRFLTLSKFGGYYFDMDIIHRRPVPDLNNFAVAEDYTKVGSSVLHFDRRFPLMHLALEEFHNNYWRNDWAYNGPDLLTRIVKSWCDLDDVSAMNNVTCKGFSVLRPWTFYPVHFSNWREFLYHRSEGEKPEWYDDDSVVGAHIWHSSFSNRWKVDKRSNQFYSQLARDYCPNVIAIAPNEF